MGAARTRGEQHRGAQVAADAYSWRSLPLTRTERIVLLAIVVLGTGASVLILVFTRGDLGPGLFQLALTVAFAVFVWSPVSAMVLFIAAVPLSYAFRSEQEMLVAAALAGGIVVRVGSRWAIAVFSAVFLIAVATVVLVAGGTGATLASALFAAAVAGAVGFVARIAADRERRLADKLSASARAEDDAVRAERQRIADELHDIIAHDLTIIAMHARVLERGRDDDTQSQSRAAIGEAAARALADLRRVVADDSVVVSGPATVNASLDDAVRGATHELTAVGYTVSVSGHPDDTRLSRLVSRTFARILRESVTNVAKHGGGTGAVTIAITIEESTAQLRVESPLATPTRTDLPSGGYGTVRMAERARGLGGTFDARPVGRTWTVTVRVPLR